MKRLAPALLLTALALPTSAHALADLTGTAVSAPPMVFAGRDATFQFTIMNIGDQDATGFIYRLYLSDNRVVTITDPSFYESPPTDLAAGESRDITVTATLPTDAMAMDYYIGVILDPSPGDVVDDPNRNNNIKRTNLPVPLRLPAPDLTVSEVRLTDEAAAGENVPVTFTIENRGNEDATFDYGVYLSANQSISTDDVLLFNRSRSLTAGQQVIVTDYVRLALGLPAGPYYVGVVMDPNDMVAELDEQNNVRGSASALDVLEPALSIRTSYFPEAVVGVPYDWRLAAEGGTGDYQWSISEGALPDGLTLDAATGAITGTPSTVGWFSFVVDLHSGALEAATGYSMLVTRPTVSLMVQTRSLPPALLQEGYETRLIATGGVPPYRWSVEAGLPAGIVLDEDGLLSGEARVIGGFPFDVQVTDARGNTARGTLTLQVVDQSMLTISTGLLPIGQVGQAFIAGFDVLGGQRPFTWSLVGGELPPGLALDSVDGVLSGSPETVGRFDFRLQVVDASGLSDTNTYSVQVLAQPVSIVETSLDAVDVGAEFSQTFHVLPSSGQPPYTWRVESGTLPVGLSLDAETGVLAGTVADDAVGTYTFVIGVQDSRGATGRRVYALEVQDPVRAAAIAQAVEPKSGCASAGGGAGFVALLLVAGAFLVGRRRRAGLALAAALALVPAGRAAAWSYTVARTSEVYQPITDGTVLSFSSMDDGVANITLPFAFDYYGQSFSSLGIDTNGLVTFGGSTSYYRGNTSIPSGSAPDGFLAPWWDDLTGNEDGTTGTLSWKVQGSYPWREVVIQWESWSRYNGGTLNFQVRLYESTRKIKFSYGAVNQSGSMSNATVGIESPDGLTGVYGLACEANCTETSWTPDTSLVFSTDPDLAVDDASGPSVLYGSVPAQLSAKVTNVGGESAGGFTVGAVLSEDDVYDRDTDTVLAGSKSVVGLAAGQSTNVSFEAMIPESVTPQQAYYIFVVANIDDTVREAQTTNNASLPVPVHIGSPIPNFRTTIPTASTTQVAPGDTLDVTFRIANSGNVGGETGWSVVLSNNEIISVDDLALDEGRVNVDPRSVANFTRTITIPATLHEGVYHLGVIADPANEISEPDEVDNASMMIEPLAVVDSTVQMLTQTVPAAQIGRPYEVWLDAAGGDGRYRWVLVGGAATLPPGLTLEDTGLLSGIPETEGDYPLQLLVRSDGKTNLGSITVHVSGYDSPLTVVTDTLPAAVFGVESATQLVAVGGTAPYTWAVTSGDLPKGMRLLEGGLLGGLPRAGGQFEFTASVTDADGTVAEQPLVMTVVEPANLLVVTLDLPQAKLGQPYETTLEAVGGSAPYRWAVEGGSRLPKGLTLDSETGVLSGTPEQVGVFDVIVQVRDAREIIDSNSLTLTVGFDQGITISTQTLPIATYDAPYQVQLTAVGGTPDYTWSLIGGSLPTGLQLGASGLISGTAPPGTDQQVVPFIVQVQDASGRTDLRGYSIRLAAAPPVTEPTGCSTTAGHAGAGAVLFALLALALRPRRRR